MKRTTVFIVAALVTFSAVSASYAFIGAGLHWGFDYSLSMDDVKNEKVNIPLDLSFLPSEVGDVDFFRVSRTNWRRSPINFGGKGYIDFIPVIEALELSVNFGLWQYDGSLGYLDLPSVTGTTIGDDNYKWVNLTIGEQNMPKYVGLDGTPYAKLQFDATVRKTLLNLWLIEVSGGAGASAHFATPLLTGKLVDDALKGIDFSDIASMNLEDLFKPGSATSKAIVQEIINKALGKPVIGMHILLGVKAKLPVMPIGIYADGKLMIPFMSYDEDVANKDNGIKGYGILLNTGLSLSF